MRNSGVAVVLCAGALLGHAQWAPAQTVQLSNIRTLYDAPFARNLESFACDVEFNWKDHFVDTTRVGDEGTDEELEKLFQPIRHRVTVTPRTVKIEASLSEEAIDKLPYSGMAEGLLQHSLEKGMYTWLPAASNSILPPADSQARVEANAGGYLLNYKVRNFDVQMKLTRDLRLERTNAKAQPDDGFTTFFERGPQGFLLASWMTQEDSDTTPNHRLIFNYTYQSVGGFQIPERVVVIRESHHESWKFKLTRCSVVTRK